MFNQKYVISDAAKMLDVEPHVLRNWEYELGLLIPRNELGHRYYTEDIIQKFHMIKKLKEHNFMLKYIRILLPNLNKLEELSSEELFRLKSKLCIEISAEQIFDMDHETDISDYQDKKVSPIIINSTDYTSYHDLSSGNSKPFDNSTKDSTNSANNIHHSANDNYKSNNDINNSTNDIRNSTKDSRLTEIIELSKRQIDKVPATSDKSTNIESFSDISTSITNAIQSSFNDTFISNIEQTLQYQLEHTVSEILEQYLDKQTTELYEKNSDKLLKSINYQLLQHEDYITEQVQTLTNIIIPPNKKKPKKKLFKSKAK